ncbi:hypothetical protein Goshw_010025 [Gossypium schwendimanii]|uniref:Uncharacterized protein n=1 Tax=Gossypium schwendimanii TaxID=34291 RepID=A0A7J9LF53_GOSSC|nr:hypothetical protein [Gossypium schwendimanii]
MSKAFCIHDILHGVGILLWRKYCTGGSATITVTGGLITYTITGSFAAMLLMALCRTTDGFVPIILLYLSLVAILFIAYNNLVYGS